MINLGLATVATLCCLQHEAPCQNKTEWKARCGLRVCAQCRAPAAARPRAARGGGRARARAGAEKKERERAVHQPKGGCRLAGLAERSHARTTSMRARSGALACYKFENSSLCVCAPARARARVCVCVISSLLVKIVFIQALETLHVCACGTLRPSLPTPRRRSAAGLHDVRSFLSIRAHLISHLMFAIPAPSALDWSVPFRAQVWALLHALTGRLDNRHRRSPPRE